MLLDKNHVIEKDMAHARLEYFAASRRSSGFKHKDISPEEIVFPLILTVNYG